MAMLGMRDCDFRFKELDRRVLIALLSATSTTPESCALKIFETFDTFQHATRADHATLAEMIGNESAQLLRTIPKAVASMTRETAQRAASYIITIEAAKTHFRALLNGRRTEAFAVIYLNAKNRPIGEDVWEGSIDRVNIYPREITRRSILLDASGIVIAHNHPSGDPYPSQEDVKVTLKLERSLDVIDVLLFDHFILGEGYAYSMRENLDF